VQHNPQSSLVLVREISLHFRDNLTEQACRQRVCDLALQNPKAHHPLVALRSLFVLGHLPNLLICDAEVSILFGDVENFNVSVRAAIRIESKIMRTLSNRRRDRSKQDDRLKDEPGETRKLKGPGVGRGPFYSRGDFVSTCRQRR
jgi:hypothetical protein